MRLTMRRRGGQQENSPFSLSIISNLKIMLPTGPERRGCSWKKGQGTIVVRLKRVWARRYEFQYSRRKQERHSVFFLLHINRIIAVTYVKSDERTQSTAIHSRFQELTYLISVFFFHKQVKDGPCFCNGIRN